MTDNVRSLKVVPKTPEIRAPLGDAEKADTISFLKRMIERVENDEISTFMCVSPMSDDKQIIFYHAGIYNEAVRAVGALKIMADEIALSVFASHPTEEYEE